MADADRPAEEDVSVVVRFTPAHAGRPPRGVIFRAETRERLTFETFAELEHLLEQVLQEWGRTPEEKISAQ